MRVSLTILRDAEWLDGPRARAWRDILLAISALVVGGWVILSHGGVDATGKAVGTDFLSFYAASKLVLAGQSAGAYNVGTHHAAEMAVLGRDVGYAAFFYPPLFLLLCAPLGLLPYLGALAAWLTATAAALAASLRPWLDRRLGWRTVASFPAVLITLAHGQNAFLSAALLSAGARWLERRPLMAGVAFGLLAFKPHLGLLLPFALLVSGRWKTLASGAATVVAFAGASVAAFGPLVWQAFLANSVLARATLEQGLVEPAKMASAFAAVRVVGGSVATAYAVQALIAIAVALALAWRLRRRPRCGAEAPLIVMAALLVSPFLLDYDLAILAFPMAWLAGRGLANGFRPWEKIALLSAYVLPAVARSLAMTVHLPLAPLVLIVLFVLILRRSSEASPVLSPVLGSSFRAQLQGAGSAASRDAEAELANL